MATLNDQRSPVILVVDDEAILRMLAADFFHDAGYEVIEAANGEQAVRAMETRHDIAAVVTDVQMPGSLDGFALSHLVRCLCPDCAIVVVSGRAAPEPGDLADRARYIEKPYEGAAVVRLVNEMLERRDA